VQQGSEALNLAQVLGVLRRRSLWIVLCFALGAIAAYAVSKHQTKQYTATASLAFGTNSLTGQLVGLPTGVSNPVFEQANDLELVRNSNVAQRTALAIGRGLSAARVASSVSIAAQGESTIIDVSSTTASPALSAAIANTYAREFVHAQQVSSRRYFKSALALVRKQIAALPAAERLTEAGVNLQNRAQTLAFLAELNYNNVQLSQQSLPPSSPSSPKTSKNVLIGGALGLFLGFALAFLLEQIDQHIRRPEELQTIFDAPLLGVIPDSRPRPTRAAGTGRPRALRQPRQIEAFNLIRAHLRFLNVARDLNSIMIASPQSGEGKTTVARHLAEAAAKSGARVLLLEVDLRKPALARAFGIQRGPGLTDVLIEAASFREAVQPIELATAADGEDERRTLDVLVAGSIVPPNPAELLESQAITELLGQARSTYDLVVIDTPPLTSVSDAFPLLTKVDGVIIVGWVGRSRRDVARSLHELLAASSVRVLGIIANGAKSTARPYGTPKAKQATMTSSNSALPVEEQLISAATTKD
jgi:polysaccharide biosynthesis transport protein